MDAQGCGAAAGCGCCFRYDDPDAFDGRAFWRRWRPAVQPQLTICPTAPKSPLAPSPCAGGASEADTVTGPADESAEVRGRANPDANPDPQKDSFEKSEGRWGDDETDQFTQPQDGSARNVVAEGMSRFEIGKVAPEQPPWERLSPSVICVLAHNPSKFTLNGTCCYLVGTGRRRLLIDTGEDSFGHAQFLESLEDCMRANGVEGLDRILITHMHGDHYGGVDGLLRRYGAATPVSKLPNPPSFWSTTRLVRQHGFVRYLEHPDGTPRWNPPPDFKRGMQIPRDAMVPWPDDEAEAGKPLLWDLMGRTKEELVRDYAFVKRSYSFGKRLERGGDINFEPLQHGGVVKTEGATLVAFATPGHSEDHCAFWHQEDRSLFSGDHVLGWGTTFIHDLHDYMASLEFMIALRPVHLYPGHGPMIEEGVELLERYIVHRRTREHQVEDLLLSSTSTARLGQGDIVRSLYRITERSRLWMAAENVYKILRKFDRSGLALPFRKLKDGALQHYDFKGLSVMAHRAQPTDLVWVHRAHLSQADVAAAIPLPGLAALDAERPFDASDSVKSRL